MLSREVNEQLWLVMLLKVALVLLQYLFKWETVLPRSVLVLFLLVFFKLLFAFSLLVPVKQS